MTARVASFSTHNSTWVFGPLLRQCQSLPSLLCFEEAFSSCEKSSLHLVIRCSWHCGTAPESSVTRVHCSSSFLTEFALWVTLAVQNSRNIFPASHTLCMTWKGAGLPHPADWLDEPKTRIGGVLTSRQRRRRVGTTMLDKTIAQFTQKIMQCKCYVIGNSERYFHVREVLCNRKVIPKIVFMETWTGGVCGMESEPSCL